jgi:hypothetical protein
MRIAQKDAIRSTNMLHMLPKKGNKILQADKSFQAKMAPMG